MNTSFKGVTTALALSATLLSPLFAHNVQAAPSDAVCVTLGKLGGSIVDLKNLGIPEEEAIETIKPSRFKVKGVHAMVVNMVRYVYLDDGKHVDARYIYLKCKVGDFD